MDTILLKNICFLSDKAVKKEKKNINIYIYIYKRLYEINFYYINQATYILMSFIFCYAFH